MVPRAPRYAIRTGIQYRCAGNMGWSNGRVENISRSGILFQGGEVVEPNSPIEMRFRLPVEIANEAGAEVICRGAVVRQMLPPATAGPLTLAAKILSYELAYRSSRLSA